MKIILILYLTAITAMSAFPPWQISINHSEFKKTEHIGYHFILSDPKPRLDNMVGESEDFIIYATVSIDWQRLLAQLVPVSSLLAIAIISLRLKNGREK